MAQDTPDASEPSKILVDSDWKAEAQAEKAKLEKKQEEAQAGPGAGQMPAADFKTLVSTMATQALFAMGAIPDPRTGQRVAHLELARHHIDMLGVIEEKTKGNLDEEEQKMIATTVYELRQSYIQLSTHPAPGSAPAPAPGGAPAAGGGQAPSPIIQ